MAADKSRRARGYDSSQGLTSGAIAKLQGLCVSDRYSHSRLLPPCRVRGGNAPVVLGHRAQQVALRQRRCFEFKHQLELDDLLSSHARRKREEGLAQ